MVNINENEQNSNDVSRTQKIIPIIKLDDSVIYLIPVL